MTTKSPFLALVVSLTAVACAADEQASGPTENGSGKADDADGAQIDCAPDDELSLELVGRDANQSSDGDALTNTVTATCFNDAGFEDAACCEAVGLFDAYRAATSCPARAELSVPRNNAAMSRCRDADGGQFVDAACCADLCDPAATRNSAGACINSGGQFEDEMCCFLATALAANSCDGAAWTTVEVGDETRDACRNDKGQFALNSCCAASCVQAVSESELSATNIPEACAAKVQLEAPQAECPDGSIENTAGICHNPSNGQFVKAACCEARGPVAVQCGFGKEPAFGVFEGAETDDGGFVDPSHQLANAVGEPASISRQDMEGDALLLDQVKSAVLHLGFADPRGRSRLDEISFDELENFADFDGYFFISGETAGVKLDWVKFFAGDTEVGTVFEAGTTQIIAEIGDGDIMGCGPA